MVVKFGEEINEITGEEVQRPWFKPGAEFSVMLIILIVILGGVIARASTKSIVINESARGFSNESMFDEDIITDWTVIPFSEVSDRKGFTLPLPLTVRPENISVENYYQDHSLFIRIKGMHAANFEGAVLTGDTSHLITAAFREYGGEVRISLLTDGIWDYSITQENSQLVIVPYKADEKFENTVAIITQPESRDNAQLNPATEVAEIAAGLLMEIETIKAEKASLENSEEKGSARIYVVENRGDDEVLDFINETGADIAIFLNTSYSEDESMYGMSAEYNDSYFIPECDNAHVAEAFLRNIAEAASDRAISITPSEEESLLDELEIPSASVSIGYISNPLEGEYLKNKSYQKSLAEGIINAINEVLEK